MPVEKVIGSSIFEFAMPENEAALRALMWGACTTAGNAAEVFVSLIGRETAAGGADGDAAAGGWADSRVPAGDGFKGAGARLAAEVANRAKDRFLALLSHELRTPLMPAMLVVSEMEMDERIPPHMRESLGIVRRSLELETRLIDDLLDLSRVVSGRLSLQTQPMDLHGVFENGWPRSPPMPRRSGCGLKWILAAPASMVVGDEARLQQVFWNLLKNAVKFSTPGGRIVVRSSVDGGAGA